MLKQTGILSALACKLSLLLCLINYHLSLSQYYSMAKYRAKTLASHMVIYFLHIKTLSTLRSAALFNGDKHTNRASHEKWKKGIQGSIYRKL
jgi:hypothetical protein